MKASKYILTTILFSIATLLFAENKPNKDNKAADDQQKSESFEQEKIRLSEIPLPSNKTKASENRWEDGFLDLYLETADHASIKAVLNESIESENITQMMIK